ncbi:MAG: HAMP domain-containing sensor histidine kinase [Parvularcula sp.]
MRFGPKSLLGQMAVVLALALLVAQAINVGFLLQSRERVREARDETAVARVLAVLERDPVLDRLVNRQTRTRLRRQRFMTVTDESMAKGIALRPHATAVFREGLAETSLEADTGAVVRVKREALRKFRSIPRSQPPPTMAPPEEGPDHGAILLSAQLSDGRWVNIIQPLPPDPPLRISALLGQAIITYGIVLVAALMLTRRLSRPLRQLTHAMGEVLTGSRTAEMTVEGPDDIQQLTDGFLAMRSRVERMFKEKDVMLGALGHDLRTPLTSLRLRAEQINDEKLRGAMIQSIEDLSAQLENILTLAREGSALLVQETVHLPAFIDGLLAQMEPIRDHVEVGPIDDIRVSLPSAAVAQAVQNLVENAVAYGARATLSAALQDDQIVFTIDDEGEGLSAEAADRLRQPFVRGETSRNRATGGAGLGLAIVDQLAHAMGGMVRFEQRPEGGGRVILQIPYQASK